MSFSGVEVITIKALNKTSCIELHSEELMITDIRILERPSSDFSFSWKGSRSLTIKSMKENDEFHTLKLLLSETLNENDEIRLYIAFNAPLRQDLRGFYQSVYIADDGSASNIATTQFESIAARTAFPCYDEPSFKAVFNLTLRVNDLSYPTILSNMHSIRDEVIDGSRVVSFADTPKMSTYLLAFIVGSFDKVSYVRDDGLVFNVYTPVNHRDEGLFALSVAINVTLFYERFFDIPYPLQKMDMIAIPDFRAGAMENWGLITYRSTRLLGPSDMSLSRRQDIAYVVAHEIAHQWAGDLVTTSFWNSIFLNEGFARFFQHYSVDRLFPEWRSWELFLSRYLQPTLSLDALPSIHPLNNALVNSQAAIESMFDVISYGKGAAVLLLFHDYLGQDAFREWMQSYFKSHMYGAVVPHDLFSLLPQKESWQRWIHAPGFPLISIVASDDQTFSFSQSRFVASSHKNTSSPW
eukprot:CAMPEP_0117425558 /NCGR_PEP_ID=MMETSP0758-20121206/5815_1 /TAXON_ID=63605 /ORGANISM="Percolomonas cosmopolitus, Strain AE-1 (ATCC 50343)" /LENGTH=466 /DNA_ID=CAMNT_0005210133 /DNA_START=252 /DNA_END=1649 /DNA_ORIENTATION=-